MKLNFNDCQINGGVLHDSNVGDYNQMVHTEKSSASKYSLNDFIDCMDEIIMNSNAKNERDCAAKAKGLAQNNDSVGLRRYIIDNINTFLTGTFATVTGGFLQEFIKALIK